MAFSIKHRFQSAKGDGADSTLVQPSNWNDTHDIQMDAGKLMGLRFPGAAGAAEEISISGNLTLAGGILDLDVDVVFPGTGAFNPPSGTTAQRPGSPVAGAIRYNSTTADLEKYVGGVWTAFFTLPTNVSIAGTLTVAGDLTFSSHGGMQIPGGTTAQRPGSPTDGTVRWNSDNKCMEIWGNSQWQQVKGTISVPKRQCVLNGPKDASTAQPTLLPTSATGLSITTVNVSSTNPLVATAALGIDATGAHDVVGYSESNQTFNSGYVTAKSVSSATVSGGTVTIQTGTAHGLATGAEVTLSGFTSANYNGTYNIVVTDATHFTYVPVTAPTATATVIGSYTVTHFFGLTISSIGAYTPFATPNPPQYIANPSPSTVSGVYTFVYTDYVMWKGNGTTADQVSVVFLGEGQVDNANISGVICYAYKARQRASLGAMPAVVGRVQFNHAIGVTQLRGQILGQCLTATVGYQPGDIMKYYLQAPGPFAAEGPFCIDDRIVAAVFSSTQTDVFNRTTGVFVGATDGALAYLVDLERAW